MKSTQLHSGMRLITFIPYQLILLSFLSIAFTFFSTSLFAQGNSVCTAVTIQPGTYQANGPSTGNGARAGCGFTGATHADWYKFTPVADGKISVSSCASAMNTRLSIFTGICLSPGPDIYNFIGGCYASDDNSCWITNSSQIIALAVTGGTTYYIQWDNRWSNLGFQWTLGYTPTPTNNNPCTAMLLNCGIPRNGTTYGATVSSITPTCTVGSHNDVFYKFPAFALSSFGIEVDGDADYDPVVVLYTGTCDGTLTQLYCNNFTSGNGTSEGAVFLSTVDQYIYVQTYDANNSGGGGNFTIQLSCPSSIRDECVNAHPITVNGPVLNGFNNYATPSTIPAGTCGDQTSNADVWYKFTSPLSGNIIIETFNDESFDGLDDSELRIFNACGGDVLFCNDDGGEGLMSRIRIPCENYTPNSLYYIQVDGFGSARGEFSISVTTEDCPENDGCADAITLPVNNPGSCPANQVEGTTLGSSPSNPDGCEPDSPDVYYTFNSGSNSAVNINLNALTAQDLVLTVFESSCSSEAIICDINFPITQISVTPFTTYYVRVHTYSDLGTGSFNICIEGIIPEIATVNGTITGWNTSCATRNIKVSFYNTLTSNTYIFNPTLSTSGTFEATYAPIPAGNYHVLVKVQGALAVLKQNVVLNGGVNNMSAGPLIMGDVNNNNVINVLDLSVFSASFGKTAGSPGYNFLADLNCDGVINIFDVSILGAGFNKTGATFPPL